MRATSSSSFKIPNKFNKYIIPKSADFSVGKVFPASSFTNISKLWFLDEKLVSYKVIFIPFNLISNKI